MGELRINISKLSEGIHEYSLEADPSRIGLAGRFSQAITVKATVEKSSRQLFFQADVATEGEFTCDRCLDDFRRDLKGHYSIVYLSDGQGGEIEGKDEVQVLSRDANFIELDEDVRQFLVLAVPQKLLCKDDCAGLCPVCGKNKNNSVCECEGEKTDPRWDGLQKIFRN